MVNAVVERDKRSIERAAAEIVDKHRFFRRLPYPFTMSEFYTGRARLIQHTEHVKAGAAECFYCQESLVAVGVSRNSQNCLERFLILILRFLERSSRAVRRSRVNPSRSSCSETCESPRSMTVRGRRLRAAA